MMPRPRRTYTAEFKTEAVKLVTERGYSVAEAALSLRVHQPVFRSWKLRLESKGPDAFHAEVKARYGSPRVHAELVARGRPCCVNTVARLMRDSGIAAKTARKFRCTTDSNHDLPVADNLLDRRFDPESPNESWVADITYIPTREGWLYLAVVEDLYARRVVGWTMADQMASRLVVDALALAVERRLPGEGLLAHSDRGSQYASDHYQRLLARHGITCSMSRRADCWDNAPMESFFASLKKE